jgi:hypothetical protein
MMNETIEVESSDLIAIIGGAIASVIAVIAVEGGFDIWDSIVGLILLLFLIVYYPVQTKKNFKNKVLASFLFGLASLLMLGTFVEFWAHYNYVCYPKDIFKNAVASQPFPTLTPVPTSTPTATPTPIDVSNATPAATSTLLPLSTPISNSSLLDCSINELPNTFFVHEFWVLPDARDFRWIADQFLLITFLLMTAGWFMKIHWLGREQTAVANSDQQTGTPPLAAENNSTPSEPPPAIGSNPTPPSSVPPSDKAV